MKQAETSAVREYKTLSEYREAFFPRSLERKEARSLDPRDFGTRLARETLRRLLSSNKAKR
jgi:hypothetical protein